MELRDSVDPETGERYTVKCYRSTKETDADGGWRHIEVTLEPANADFEPIVIAADEDADVAVVAELVSVLGEAVAREGTDAGSGRGRA